MTTVQSVSHDSEPSPGDSSSQLVSFLREKNPAAGALLHTLYRESLLRFCRGYLGEREASEDAVQDICVRVLTTSDVPDLFRPWMYRIARNHCLNLLRARVQRKEGHILPAPSQVYDTMTGNLTRLVRDEAGQRLAELFLRLSDEQREAIRLRYVEDLSRGEIAAVLEVSESVVKSRIFEGLKKLRELASRSES